MEVRLLRPDDEAAYQTLVLSRSDSLIYASLAYRNFLNTILPHSRALYLVALDAGRLVGALPAFLSHSRAHGKVLNSLPFFGSHGGVVAAPDVADPSALKGCLLRAFVDLAQREAVRSCTIISSPFEEHPQIYSETFRPTHQDSRVGQFSPLPSSLDGTALAERLMQSFHQKTRNMVRKGLSGGFKFRRSVADDDLAWLQQVHEQNMIAAKAPPKSVAVLRALQGCFSSNHCIYIAEFGNERIAGLLVVYFNGRAEYYTPAIIERFRSQQVLSYLIFHAMQDAAQKGCREWDWGGTASHQLGVYRFKKRWNAIDRPYQYYVKLLDPTLEQADISELSSEFQYFYLFPFQRDRTDAAHGPASEPNP